MLYVSNKRTFDTNISRWMQYLSIQGYAEIITCVTSSSVGYWMACNFGKEFGRKLCSSKRALTQLQP